MPGIALGTGNTTGSVIHPACIPSFILKPGFLCRCPPLLHCMPLGEVGPTPSSMVAWLNQGESHSYHQRRVQEWAKDTQRVLSWGLLRRVFLDLWNLREVALFSRQCVEIRGWELLPPSLKWLEDKGENRAKLITWNGVGTSQWCHMNPTSPPSFHIYVC